MSTTSDGPILLVGAGRMGSALLKGWLAQGVGVSRVIVQEPSPQPDVAEFLKNSGVGLDAADDAAGPPAVIVLAVKPQVMDEVAASISSLAGAETVILSIAAGRTIASLAKHFNPNTAIVRVMPNTPAAIGQGISALYANDSVTKGQAKLCETLMQAAGETVWVDNEDIMDAVTAVSGSGPAYVFHLTECLAEAGVAVGLPPELAAKLAAATVSGAGALMKHEGLTPAELRRNVTSPGGTTEAALNVLMGDKEKNDQPMHDLLRDAVTAAARRSKELAG